MGTIPPRGRGRFTSAGELGEYAYCRRAWYYRTHPGALPSGVTGPGEPSSFRRGRRSHRLLEDRHVREQGISLARSAAWLLLSLGLLGAWLWWVFR